METPEEYDLRIMRRGGVKEIHIYHRKELVHKLKMMINFAGMENMCLMFPDNVYDRYFCDASSIRQFRNLYKIYECF